MQYHGFPFAFGLLALPFFVSWRAGARRGSGGLTAILSTHDRAGRSSGSADRLYGLRAGSTVRYRGSAVLVASVLKHDPFEYSTRRRLIRENMEAA